MFAPLLTAISFPCCVSVNYLHTGLASLTVRNILEIYRKSSVIEACVFYLSVIHLGSDFVTLRIAAIIFGEDKEGAAVIRMSTFTGSASSNEEYDNAGGRRL